MFFRENVIEQALDICETINTLIKNFHFHNGHLLYEPSIH